MNEKFKFLKLIKYFFNHCLKLLIGTVKVTTLICELLASKLFEQNLNVSVHSALIPWLMFLACVNVALMNVYTRDSLILYFCHKLLH